MISKEAERLHQQSLIVEGHRDVFEMVRLKRSGESFPLIKKIVPRLKKGGITISVFAVCGDAVSHSNGTYRYRMPLSKISMRCAGKPKSQEERSSSF
jgi:hypothetical protein